MQNCLLVFLVFIQLFSYNQTEQKIATYINPINQELIKLDYDSKNEINNLLDFVNEHSIHPIKAQILNDYILEAIIKALDDEYAHIDNLSSQEYIDSINGKYNGFGFDLAVIGTVPNGKYVVSNVLENSDAFVQHLQVGDIIESINGIKVYANKKLYEGALDMNSSNLNHQFVVLRNNNKLEFTLSPKEYTEPPINSKVLNKNIYYIKINNCSQNMPLYMEAELNKFNKFKYQHLIIDLRHNLGGWQDSAIKVSAMMCDDNIIAYQKDKKGISKIARGETKQITNIKPIVLISKNTASSAELLAECLRLRSGATLIGEKTFGKNQSQGVYEFGGRMLKFTNALISADDKFLLNFSGVEPDILVVDQYKSPYVDLVLQKAMEWLE